MSGGKLRVVKPSDIDLPALPGSRKRSTPGRRLMVGLVARALDWGSILALINGAWWIGLAGMLVARVAEWHLTEDARW